jgi:uncharacterized membrane protein YkvA (DUF1232 family)
LSIALEMHDDFYRKLREKLKEWARSKEGKAYKYTEYIVVIPDLMYLLCKLIMDKEVEVGAKAKLGIALAYIVSPFDFLPEGLIGPVGFSDDVVVAAYVLNSIINTTDPAVVRRHWVGDEDILELVKRIIKSVDDIIGKGLFEKIKKMFDNEK